MDDLKIVGLLIQYFGEAGAIIVLATFVVYGVTKYIIIKKQALVISRIEQYLRVLSQKYSDTITYEQVEIVLRDAYLNTACCIIQDVYDIIDRNNIEKDWKSVVAKIKDIIEIRYSEDFSKLSKFVYNDKSLSQVMDCDNKDYLIQGIQGILEKQKKPADAKSQVLSFIKNSFMRFYNLDLVKTDRRKSET